MSELSDVLFCGMVKAAHFHFEPGTDKTSRRADVEASILASMERMGVTKNGELQDPND